MSDLDILFAPDTRTGVVPIETWRDYWRQALNDNPAFIEAKT